MCRNGVVCVEKTKRIFFLEKIRTPLKKKTIILDDKMFNVISSSRFNGENSRTNFGRYGFQLRFYILSCLCLILHLISTTDLFFFFMKV